MADGVEDKPRIERDANGFPIYRPDGRVLRGFLRSEARVRIVRGPIRSGTSSACCLELWRRACEQAPGEDGIRRTRFFVTRNTYPDLVQSTVRTWLNWFPERDFGRFVMSKPMEHRMRKGDVHCDVVFLSLDKEDDIGKLKSTEWTGGWFNEGQFTIKAIFDEAESRIGYYPAVKDGGPTWSGLIMDMNSPPSDHWLPLMTGEAPFPEDWGDEERQEYRWPETWEYFVQPPGLIEVLAPDGKSVQGYELNPDAENLRWIPRVNGNALYIETIKGKGRRWIDANLMNRIVPPLLGTTVFPMFNTETHVAREVLRFNPLYPLYVGLDFGRNPACVIGQMISDRWQLLGELGTTDGGASVFAPMVRRYIAVNFPEAYEAYFNSISLLSQRTAIRFYGDPKGADKVQSDEATAYDFFRDNGMLVRKAPIPTNAIQTRLDCVRAVLNSARDGMQRFLSSPSNRVLNSALAGGYHFKRGVDEEPVKNRYSDYADSLQYLFLGAGEGHVMVGRDRPEQTAEPVQAFRGRRTLRRVRA